MTALRILQPGPQTSVQDRGRIGFQAFGVPVCGVLDAVALRLANALVGNPATAAALEMRLSGPSFIAEGGAVRIALAGATARIDVSHDGETRAFPGWRAIEVPEGASVRIGALGGSGCAILAIAGGIMTPLVMGSRSTDLKGRFGGIEGRALAAGDEVPIDASDLSGPCLELPRPPASVFSATLRVVMGPQAEAFTEAGRETFLSSPYRVSREADRMGMRLEGPALGFVKSADIVSDGIATGSIQVPGSGLPIMLLADHQTIGGYAKIATVISADLPAAGRLLPGAEIRFAAVSVAEAEQARRELESEMARLIASLVPVREGARVDMDALWRANLVSGVVSALETE
ncbi:biotin-dependent carboxyltransferase family protein [Ancylobacter radicis]|uniref:Biotin-dependent carboxyltransferase family protein n=1 Tax=Ancylobacter radicis TaxID=2836179 RepID=A0ABS5RA60_9HYPH|nr:biotin-dependent carboxyltransferase family protein [Ancylobacter radicis]MBS9477992.1 biotin-dependent carboxyltransferase family protein [Ancylobacter radicis]